MKHTVAITRPALPAKADGEKGLTGVYCGPLKEILGKCLVAG